MKFTSIPQNGSSWQNSLPVSFDTELSEPSDVVLRLTGLSNLNVTRRLYGVTQATIDVAPYLRSYSCSLPQIGNTVTIVPSRSAQRLQISADDVASPYIVLFHAPYDNSTSHLMSSASGHVKHPYGEPILLTAYAARQLSIVVATTTQQGTTSQTLIHKTNGIPVDIVVPPKVVHRGVTNIRIDISDEAENIASIEYELVEKRNSATTLVWFNRHGGIECYTFPVSLRVSYDAQLAQSDAKSVERYVPLSSAKVCYRLCSAYEPATQMDALAEIPFSPRVFCLDNGVFTPISLCNRHVEFDSHGTLKQMCIDIEQSWEGGVR